MIVLAHLCRCSLCSPPLNKKSIDADAPKAGAPPHEVKDARNGAGGSGLVREIYRTTNDPRFFDGVRVVCFGCGCAIDMLVTGAKR